MNRFDVANLLWHVQALDAFHINYASAKRGAENVSDEHYALLMDRITQLAVFCSEVGFDQTFRKIGSSVELLQKRRLLNRSVVSTETRNIREAIASEAEDRVFWCLSKDRVAYADQKALFGERVHENFESARTDVTQSGKCLAAECHTAAVFHLMRVAEVGLRALARDRRIKHLPKKSQPIELATWEELLRELEQAELAIQGYPKTLAREAQYEFVHGAMMQFRRFKNVFRNRVMHTREDFGRAQALGVFENVRDFMRVLASRISERKLTPKIWKGPHWTVQPAP